MTEIFEERSPGWPNQVIKYLRQVNNILRDRF